jgi:hypothetical protein
VIIRAHEDYYPVDRIPQFWIWLLKQAESGVIKMPRVIFDEVTPPPGPLADWLKRPEVKEALVLDEPTSGVTQVIDQGYSPDLNDVEILRVGKDPFLVAAALAGSDRVVVTREVSKPSMTRAKRQVPDVCAMFGITAITDFKLYSILKFSIP